MPLKFDLDDENTWDELSQKEIEELAVAGAIPTDEADETEPPVKVEPKAEEPKAEEPPKQRPMTAEEGDILAADGKNVIPYTVLRDARSQLNETRAALDAAKAQLAALQTQPAAAAPEQPAEFVIPDDVKAEIEKIRENWGDDLAAQAERSYYLEAQAVEQQRIIDHLSQYVSTQQTQQTRTEQETIEDAIAASPTLDEWAKAEDQSLFDHAVEIHSTLLKIDKNYRALSWFDRMRVLPDKVAALTGLNTPEKTPPKVDTATVAKAVQDAMDAPPKSLSDLSGGTTPEKTDFDKLEDLSGNQLTAYMDKLARDPRKFEAYLRSMS